jgi:hypothetical protein
LKTSHIVTLALAGVVAVSLSGCGGEPLTSGTVTSKEHDQAKTTCSRWTGTGTKRRCAKWKHESEEWEIDIKDGGKTGEVEVDQATWDTYKVGDHFLGGNPVKLADNANNSDPARPSLLNDDAREWFTVEYAKARAVLESTAAASSDESGAL